MEVRVGSGFTFERGRKKWLRFLIHILVILTSSHHQPVSISRCYTVKLDFGSAETWKEESSFMNFTLPKSFGVVYTSNGNTHLF